MTLKQTIYIGTNALIESAKRLYNIGEITKTDLEVMIQRNNRLSEEEQLTTIELGVGAYDYSTIRRYI